MISLRLVTSYPETDKPSTLNCLDGKDLDSTERTALLSLTVSAKSHTSPSDHVPGGAKYHLTINGMGKPSTLIACEPVDHCFAPLLAFILAHSSSRKTAKSE